ncbi:hypothetical protein D3C81_1410690 [compost metagenome]
MQLVERLEVEVVGEAEVPVQHGHRQQRFLDLRTRPAQGGDVDRVDGVDAVLKVQAFAPVDHLVADPGVERVVGDVEVTEHIGVEQGQALELGQLVEVAVVQFAVGLVAVGGMAEVHFTVAQGVVVPGLAANEGAVVAPVQLHLAEQGDGRGHQVALAEVEAAVVAGTPALGIELAGRTVADAVGVTLEDVVGTGLFCTPQAADAQAAVVAAADFAPVEFTGAGIAAQGAGQWGEQECGQ